MLRNPIVRTFATAYVALTCAALLLIRNWHGIPGFWQQVLLLYNPCGIWLADRIHPLFFETRGLAPDGVWFWELLLALGFGAQGALAAALLQTARIASRRYFRH